MLSVRNNLPAAVVLGCANTELSDEELDLFKELNPFGFILFERNCKSPGQVVELVRSLRDSVKREDAPVLIDQEGGNVQRLKPPHWNNIPSAELLGLIYDVNNKRGLETSYTAGRLIASELATLEISVNCAPVLDVFFESTTKALAGRTYSSDPSVIINIAKAFYSGLCEGGILPVIKHMPGHGRAKSDSHIDVPKVRASHHDLTNSDFNAFKAFSSAPLGMTAHVTYESLDSNNVATNSSYIIQNIIRQEIGFDGLLFSDDICMGALKGNLTSRCENALNAGCDVVLHCSGNINEMSLIKTFIPSISLECESRWNTALNSISGYKKSGSISEFRTKLEKLLN